jgi:sulfoxide reductase heme-binding subunit YedZ
MIGTSSTALWYTTRATGTVALVLLTGTLVLGILTAGRVRARSWPRFAQADLHKRVSLLAMVFLALHVLTSVLDTYVHVGWAAIIVPFASQYRPAWTGLGTVGVDLILAVAISSAFRQRIRSRTWRGIHWLAYGSWPVAMFHSLGMGTDASTLWMDGLAVLCSVAVISTLGWRISDAKKSRDRAISAGAITRAAPVRLGSDPIQTGPTRAEALPAPLAGTSASSAPSRPGLGGTTTQILERHRR